MKTSLQLKEVVKHIVRFVSFARHIARQLLIRDRSRAIIDEQCCADVRMHNETGESAEEHLQVIRFLTFAAFGVRNGDDTVNVWVRICNAVKFIGEAPCETGGARRCAHHDDVVPRADTALPWPPIAAESPLVFVARHLISGAEVCLIQGVRCDDIAKVGTCRQREIKVPNRQRLNHLLVADVIAGCNRA